MDRRQRQMDGVPQNQRLAGADWRTIAIRPRGAQKWSHAS